MWQLNGSKALLATSNLKCELDLAWPMRGLTNIAGKLEASQLFRAAGAAIMQLTLPSKATVLADAYVRGSDLVATYEESIAHPCRTQVYWRIENELDCLGIQLIVSVQTSILDATPVVTLKTKVAGGVQMIDDGIAMMPLTDSEVCYVEIADDSNVEAIIHDDMQLTSRLFPGSLEKGVIRRARILGCFLPIASFERTARKLRDQFVRSAPPLTT